MISSSIVKLIDEAIIPTVALIAAKMLGLFLASYMLAIPLTIKNAEILGFLPSVHFNNLQDYRTIENYSNLIMFAAAAVGSAFVLIRAHFFHESHIHPVLHAKLTSLNLTSLIAPTYHLYHQAAIWLMFLWLCVGFLTISTFLEVTYPQVTIIAFVIAVNFSWIFAVDIEKEIQIARGN